MQEMIIHPTSSVDDSKRERDLDGYLARHLTWRLKRMGKEEQHGDQPHHPFFFSVAAPSSFQKKSGPQSIDEGCLQCPFGT